MAWTWNDQNLSNRIKRKTEWKSPNVVTQCLSPLSSTVELNHEPVSRDDLNYSIGQGETTEISRRQNFHYVDINSNPPLKGIWDDLDNIKTVSTATTFTYDYATFLSVNTWDQNVMELSPTISCRDFDLDVPTGSTITGIEIKITKSAYDSVGITCRSRCIDNSSYIDNFTRNNITNYTFDDVVMISLSEECNSDIYEDTLYNSYRSSFDSNLMSNDNIVPQYTFLSNYYNYAKPFYTEVYEDIGKSPSCKALVIETSLFSSVLDTYQFLGFDVEDPFIYDDVANCRLYNIYPAQGIWENFHYDVWTEERDTKKTYLYGGENELWGGTILDIKPTNINKSDFGLYFKCVQKVERSYGGLYGNLQDFRTSTERLNWYTHEYDKSLERSCHSYQTSRLHDIQIRVHYELETETETIDSREDIFNSGNTLKTNDVYFKFQRCFNGICYQYVNGINDIYNISLMTGDGLSISNMYNVYNVIDEYCDNIYRVDVATTDAINLDEDYFEIDNVKLKPGHLVLLLDQASASTNDIYKVNENYFLENSNILSTREKAYRAKAYIKLGSHYQKQYFLNPSSGEFPITGETKYFTSGHSYIIKNYVNYNIKNRYSGYTYDSSGNTLTSPNKMLFTNYKVARTLSENITWSDIEFTPLSAITIEYLDQSYHLTNEQGLVYFDMSGSTSAETYRSWSGLSFFNLDPSFTISSVGDHSLISFRNVNSAFTDLEMIPTDSDFNYLSQIRYIDSNYVAFDEIPEYLFNNLQVSSNTYRYRIRNLHYCSATTESYEEYLRYSPYANILNIKEISGLNMKPYDNQTPTLADRWRYFDYGLVTVNNIYNGTTAYTFSTNNSYQNYTLYDTLSTLGPLPTNMYNDAYLLGTTNSSGEYYIEEIFEDAALYGKDRDGSFHSSGGTSSTYYSRQSSRWKIIPYDTNILKNFKPYTYVDYGVLSTTSGNINLPYSFIDGDSGRTLILEVTDEYMILQKPRLEQDPASSYYNPTNNLLNGLTYDIINVSKIQDISDILLELYKSYPHSYYYNYPENEYNRICGAYAEILKGNSFARNLASGILYQKDDLFNLNIFNLNIDENFNHLDDVNLTFEPIELIDVGIDKKPKLPIPLEIDDIVLSQNLFDFYTGLTTDAYSPISEPISYVRTTNLVGDRLYVNINYQGLYHFNNQTTNHPDKYYNQNTATLVFDSSSLYETGLTHNYLINQTNSNSNNIMNYDVLVDDSGSTYEIGYSSTISVSNQTHTWIELGNTNSLSNKLFRSPNKTFGHIIKYNSELEVTTAITFKNNSSTNNATGRVVSMINNVENTEMKNYVLLSGDKNKYYYKINNVGTYSLINSNGSERNNTLLVKFSDDFTNIEWQSFIEGFMSDGIGGWISAGDCDLISSNHITKDSDDDYLYHSFSYNNGTLGVDSIKIRDASTSNLKHQIITNGNYSTYNLVKYNLDGDVQWSKTIYQQTYYPGKIVKILYHNNNIYMIINSRTKLIIDGVVYGDDETSAYIIKIDKNGNFIWLKKLGINKTSLTDIKVHNDIIYVSAYFSTTTKLGSYVLSPNASYNSSYVVKILEDGTFNGIYQKYSSESLSIKSINLIDDKLYIAGEWTGGAFFGGNRPTNYITTNHNNVFVEEIKINSF